MRFCNVDSTALQIRIFLLSAIEFFGFKPYNIRTRKGYALKIRTKLQKNIVIEVLLPKLFVSMRQKKVISPTFVSKITFVT